MNSKAFDKLYTMYLTNVTKNLGISYLLELEIWYTYSFGSNFKGM